MTERNSHTAGALLVDKPEGPTSHDVVARVRRLLDIRRAGHTGTLDPMASGLLVLLLGQATRLARFLSGYAKEYAGQGCLGRATDTYDRTGRATGEPMPTGGIGQAELEQAAAALTGRQMQVPPPYSARKVDGVRLYRHARSGRSVQAPPAEVEVESFAIRLQAAGQFTFETRVSSGTYVRSLVHDLGISLGCGAHLTALRRTAIGPLRLDGALTLDRIGGDPAAALAGPAFLPLDAVPLPLPIARADAQDAAILSQGRAFRAQTGGVPAPGLYQVRDGEGRLLALASAGDGGVFQPRTVFSRPAAAGFTPPRASGSF